MKKKLFVLVSLFILIFTTGCIQQKDDYIIMIDKNDNVVLSETVGIAYLGTDDNNEMLDYILSAIKKVKGIKGFSKKDYREGEYVGFIQTKDGILLSDVRPNDLMPGLKFASRTFAEKDNGFLKDTYKIHLKYNYVKAYNEINKRVSASQNNEGVEKHVLTALNPIFIDNTDGTHTIKSTYYEDGFSGTSSINVPNPKITLTIKIPAKATKHNATKVISESEYQWDLFALNTDVDINLEYSKPSQNIAGLLVISSLFLLLVLLGLIYIKHKEDISF